MSDEVDVDATTTIALTLGVIEAGVQALHKADSTSVTWEKASDRTRERYRLMFARAVEAMIEQHRRNVAVEQDEEQTVATVGDHREMCEQCGGEGRVKHPFGQWDRKITCWSCGGTGYIENTEQQETTSEP